MRLGIVKGWMERENSKEIWSDAEKGRHYIRTVKKTQWG